MNNYDDYLYYDDMYMLLGTSLIRAFSVQSKDVKKKELQTFRFPNIITEIKQHISTCLKVHFCRQNSSC